MKNKKLFKQFITEIYNKENRKIILLVILCSIIKSILMLIPPLITMKIIDKAIPEHSISKIVLYSFLVLFITVFNSFLEVKMTKIYNILGKKISIHFQEKCILHLFQLNGSFYAERSTGDIFTTILQDVGEIKMLASSTVFDFASDVLVAIGTFFILLFMQWDLLLIILFVIPAILFCQKYFQKKEKEKVGEVRKAHGKLMGVLENIISNTLNTIFSNGNKYFIKKYKEAADQATDKEINMHMLFAVNMGILNFLSTILMIVVLFYGGIQVIYGGLTIGALLAFNMYSGRLTSPIFNLTQIIMQFQTTVVSMERIKDFLNIEKIKGNNNPILFQKDKDSFSIRLDQVNFYYEENQPILKEINMEFLPNKIHAIVGKSGCGKSSIVSLFYRIWDVRNGLIKIGERDIKEYDLESLRNNITVVSQESFLFDDTILNNILLGTKAEKEKVVQYAKTACIHDYIMGLPDQYETVIGEDGVKLSGGEKQRICIARALLKENQILILDEATSALDQVTEQKILLNIKKEIKDTTILIITHRLQSIQSVDRIFVIRDGLIDNYGTDKELRAKCRYYQELILES